MSDILLYPCVCGIVGGLVSSLGGGFCKTEGGDSSTTAEGAVAITCMLLLRDKDGIR